MCKNATATAASIMLQIEPTLASFLTIINVPATEAQAAEAAFAAAQKAVAAWTPGSAVTDVIAAVEAFNSVFQAIVAPLGLPPEIAALASIISAGIVTVLGIIQANSPAPAAPTTTPADPASAATPEEIQAAHQTHVIADTTVQVQKLVPGYHRALFTSPAHQYKNEWNKGVEKAGPKYAALKV